ncbi:DUF2378 family protein [Myxococcaceae bacterium GXIMD 01537]
MSDSGARKFGAETAPPGPRRMVFEHTVEGLFHEGLRRRLSSSARATLREAGLDLGNKLRPAYPFETWRRCLDIAVEDLYRSQGRPEGYRLLGHEFIAGLAQTPLGRATVRVARLLGPLRSLRRLNPTLGGADPFLESRLTELDSTRCELWLNEVMDQPTYALGILEAWLPLAGAQLVRVAVRSREALGATYLLEWKA